MWEWADPEEVATIGLGFPLYTSCLLLLAMCKVGLCLPPIRERNANGCMLMVNQGRGVFGYIKNGVFTYSSSQVWTGSVD